MATLLRQDVEQRLGHRLHPVFHAFTQQFGNRVDKVHLLPADLKEVDLEEILELMSEPPQFSERLCPVSLQVGQTTLRGKSLPDLMVKGYRHFSRIFTGISLYVLQTVRNNFGEPGMVPFMSMGIDPDFCERLINADYDDGETTHSAFMDLIEKGVLSPAVTIPFGVMLPTLESEFDVRMLIRMALFYHWHLLEMHSEYHAKIHGENRFVISAWLPEGGFSKRVLQILHEEFIHRAMEAGHSEPHLVLLLDNHQVPDRDNDRLMKSWNMVRLDESSGEYISVLFRDRGFSEWVSYSNPSVKKLLDRTIAKVDAELNSEEVDYCWSHFEEVETLLLSPKASLNFEQKVTKLAELGYLPSSPDSFVRRKLLGKYGRAEGEPREVSVEELSAWIGWNRDNESADLGRWLGVRETEENGPVVESVRKVKRPGGEEGPIEERMPQCWKVALQEVLRQVLNTVRGNPESGKDGMLGVLRSLIKSKNPKIVQRNISAFIEKWALCHWSEHFIQHEMSEAEINISDLVNDHLLDGCRGKLSEEEMLQAAVSVQAYHFALEAHRANAFSWETMDNRAVYHAVLMASQALVNMIYVHHWRGEAGKEKACHEVLREYLMNFDQMFKRLDLEKIGVKEADWKRAIKSAIPESKDNVVRRAAMRCAARHLRPLGYRHSASDIRLTTSVGHMWTPEVMPGHFRWENPDYCGVPED